MKWAKSIVTWYEDGRLCVSVPFTWLLPKARDFCLQHAGERLVVGGPAVRLMEDELADVAEIETFVPADPLLRANPLASRTSFGCPNACGFCGVRRIEGEHRELGSWRPAPILCDSNFLACSDHHFDRVVDRLKQADFKFVDFNQGLDAALLTKRRADRLAELRGLKPRFAWDTAKDEDDVLRAVELMEAAGMRMRASSPKACASAPCSVYCLVGWRETPAEATYRLETLREQGLAPFAMRYQPLDTLKKNSYCPPQWDPRLLADFVRYWNCQRWLGGVTFDQYREGVGHNEPALDAAVSGA